MRSADCRPQTALPVFASTAVHAQAWLTDSRLINVIGLLTSTSCSGPPSTLVTSASTAALPSSARGIATLDTATSRNARHSSSSKLSTDIAPGTATPAWRSAASTPNNWLMLPTAHAVGVLA